MGTHDVLFGNLGIYFIARSTALSIDTILSVLAFLVCSPIALGIHLDLMAAATNQIPKRTHSESKLLVVVSIFQLCGALFSTDTVVSSADEPNLSSILASVLLWLSAAAGFINWRTG